MYSAGATGITQTGFTVAPAAGTSRRWAGRNIPLLRKYTIFRREVRHGQGEFDTRFGMISPAYRAVPLDKNGGSMAAAVAGRTRISVERYQRMIATGVLTRDDRVELIEGEMFDMAPTGSRHAAVSMNFYELFSAARGLARVSFGGPVKLGEFSEPQPDVMLLRLRDDYKTRIPEAADVLLAVEIADSSLACDRITKLALYARHGIAEYWIVDVTAECVERYRDPVSNAYLDKRIAGGAEVVAPRALSSLRITVRDIFA